MTYLKDLIARYESQVAAITDKTYSCEADHYCVEYNEEKHEFNYPKRTWHECWPNHCKKSRKNAMGRANRVIERLIRIEVDSAIKKDNNKKEPKQ